MNYKMEMGRGSGKYMRQVKVLMRENGYSLIRSKNYQVFRNDNGDMISVSCTPNSDETHILKRIRSDIRRKEDKRQNRDF